MNSKLEGNTIFFLLAIWVIIKGSIIHTIGRNNKGKLLNCLDAILEAAIVIKIISNNTAILIVSLLCLLFIKNLFLSRYLSLGT